MLGPIDPEVGWFNNVGPDDSGGRLVKTIDAGPDRSGGRLVKQSMLGPPDPEEGSVFCVDLAFFLRGEGRGIPAPFFVGGGVVPPTPPHPPLLSAHGGPYIH